MKNCGVFSVFLWFLLMSFGKKRILCNVVTRQKKGQVNFEVSFAIN